jgi:uncharacterized protein YkwD
MGKRRMMRYRWFIVAALFTVLFVGLISDQKSAGAEESYDSEERKFLEIINKYRQDKGLPTLSLSDTLTVASERHSEDMARYNFFDHKTVKSSYFPAGSKPWDRMARSGYDHPNARRAENLAAGYETAEKNFEAWRASPGHNANMLDGNQRAIGIARVHVSGSAHGWYWTTDLGSEVDSASRAPGETSRSEEKKASERERAPEEDNKDSRSEERKASEEERAPEDHIDRYRNADQGGVENGSMKGAVIWKQKTAKSGNRLIDKDVARLGGYNGAVDEISQKIQIQRGQKLVYWVWVATEERERPADGLVVRLTDETGRHLAILDSHTDADAEKTGENGWIQDSVDLSRFAGRTARLSFLAKTNGERPTVFYVDAVALKDVVDQPSARQKQTADRQSRPDGTGEGAAQSPRVF